MSYIYGVGYRGMGADSGPLMSVDEPVDVVLQRIQANYVELRKQLVAQAAVMVEKPTMVDRAIAWVTRENLDMDAPAGQSLLAAVRRYDEAMRAVVDERDFSRAEELLRRMQGAAKMWNPNGNLPWSGLLDSIIDDIKKLPRRVVKATAAFAKDLVDAAAEGLGVDPAKTTDKVTKALWIAGGVAAVAAMLYGVKLYRDIKTIGR